VNAEDDNPLGAVERMMNVSVTAADTVPVTDAADVKPLMPVTAILTVSPDDDSVGALKSGAEDETYCRRSESNDSDTCHEVSWFDAVKKSIGTLIVSPV